MIAMIADNLIRRRGRTLLTASGIAVGVATIVALLTLTSGLERRAGELVRLGRADLGIFQRNAADLTTSVLPLSLVEELRDRPDISDATPIQLLVEGVRDDPGAVVFGGDLEGFLAQRLVFSVGGPGTRRGDVVVGDRLAAKLKLRIGSKLAINSERYRVAGIYHSGVYFEDAGAILPLREAQRLAGRRADEATTIAVALAPGAPAREVTRSLGRAYPSLLVIDSPDEAARLGANSALISRAVPLLVVLALIVGGLGVANTMVTAVLERQRVIALLGAVGWSPRQLGTLVMGEALGVSVLGAALGIALGVLAGQMLPRVLSLLDVVDPQVTAGGLVRGLLVGVAIGVLGGIYPTWRAIRMDPAGVLAQA